MRSLVGLIAAAVMATMFVMPADARAKKPKRPAVVQTQQASPSLDGRTLGRMRTCGFDYLQYGGLGDALRSLLPLTQGSLSATRLRGGRVLMETAVFVRGA
jgi:hypothetical protein